MRYSQGRTECVSKSGRGTVWEDRSVSHSLNEVQTG